VKRFWKNSTMAPRLKAKRRRTWTNKETCWLFMSQSGFGFQPPVANARDVLALMFAKQGGDSGIACQRQVLGGAGSAIPGRHKTVEEMADCFHGDL